MSEHGSYKPAHTQREGKGAVCVCVCAMKRSMSEICRSVSSANTRQEKRVNRYLIRSKLIDSDCVLVLIKREICQVD